MTVTTILAIIGGTTLVLTAAARIPAALAEFLRALIPLIAAIQELRHTVNSSKQLTQQTATDTHKHKRKISPR